ncbi:TonB-dependent receptor plug domain-containing protein [Microbulbifer sp. 2201CG32-9]|uniref:TonB-dependent receptor plug domain-containing protein n=1 Tax=Microbulbifer sp. 2201CG32-9 TaxID=3232309 RepID=UPI00345C3820
MNRFTFFSIAMSYASGTIASVEGGVENKGNDKNLEEVIITEKVQLSEPTEIAQKLLKVPGALGDPIQAVFSMPGVVQREDGGEPAVRGSSPDDNAYLVDALPAGNIFHNLLGNSIFNENLLRDFGLQPGGFSSKYGMATGAIFDISLRQPRFDPLSFTLDASMLQLGVLAEGEITEDQAFYLSYRESLIHLFLEDEEDGVKVTSDPRASDYQGKYFWRLNNNNSLSFLVLGASDEAAREVNENSEEGLLDPAGVGKQSLDSRFDSQGLTWSYTGDDDKTASEWVTALGHIRDQQNFRVGIDQFMDLEADTLTFKSQYGFSINQGHRLTLGAELQQQKWDYQLSMYQQTCSDFNPNCEVDRGPLIRETSQQKIELLDIFLEDEWVLGDNWLITAGLRASQNRYLDENHLEPRLAVSWQVSEALEIHGSTGLYHQMPGIDQVIPVFGNPNLSSPTAKHLVAGFNWDLGNEWSLLADVYYKDLDQLVVDVDDENLLYTNSGVGKAYGMELMLNKNLTDKWYGWISVSLSKTERTNTLTGETSPFYYDTPIVMNWVMNYQISELWNIGTRWNYRSGAPYTPIIGNKPDPNFPGHFVPVYGDLNSERADAYHRLDLRLEREFQGERLHGSFFIDIINAYGAANSGAVEYVPIQDSNEYKLENEGKRPGITPCQQEPSYGAAARR